MQESELRSRTRRLSLLLAPWLKKRAPQAAAKSFLSTASIPRYCNALAADRDLTLDESFSLRRADRFADGVRISSRRQRWKMRFVIQRGLWAARSPSTVRLSQTKRSK